MTPDERLELDKYIQEHLFHYCNHVSPDPATTRCEKCGKPWQFGDAPLDYAGTWEGMGWVVYAMKKIGWEYGLESYEKSVLAYFWKPFAESVSAETLTAPEAVALACKIALSQEEK